MCADAQRDGRPAEYRWRPLLERLGLKVNFAPGKIPLWDKSLQNVYIVYQPRRRPNVVQSVVDLR